MTEVGEKYRCNVCGNVVEIINAGGGTLMCCSKEMQPARDIGAALLERKQEGDELEKEELEEMVEEIKGGPEEEETEEEW
jgi:desulfoferrodoxin-like iron-binding protein